MTPSKDVKETLLHGWEDVYKKSQLTLWILLALKDSPKSMSDIKTYMLNKTQGTIGADDMSMYRALRRFDEADLIRSVALSNTSGPIIKVWHLTETGKWVLSEFIERNIRNVFLSSENKSLFR